MNTYCYVDSMLRKISDRAFIIPHRLILFISIDSYSLSSNAVSRGSGRQWPDELVVACSPTRRKTITHNMTFFSLNKTIADAYI